MATPNPIFLPLPPPPPVLLPALLPPFPRPPPPLPPAAAYVATALGAILLRFQTFLFKMATNALTDPDHFLRKAWTFWVHRQQERRVRRLPILPLPITLRFPNVALLLRGLLRGLPSRRGLIIAAAIAVGGLFLFTPTRAADEQEDDDPRLLPLQVRRALRASAYRLLLPTPAAREFRYAAAPVGVFPRHAASVGVVLRRAAPPRLLVVAPQRPVLAGARLAAPPGLVLAAPPLAALLQLQGGFAPLPSPQVGVGLRHAPGLLRAATPNAGLLRAADVRQNDLKALTETSKECESSLKTNSSKFHAISDKFYEDKARGTSTGKPDKAPVSDREGTVPDETTDTENSLKNTQKGDDPKTFASSLRPDDKLER
ncbi:hypothetical protein ZWY2020_034721 [Hordeum vulgare]|nr:hypothetical protein ZWY2020_034721 [Hordeum vulgare]